MLGTANHYVLDVVGGTAVMAVGGALATVLTTADRARLRTGAVLRRQDPQTGWTLRIRRIVKLRPS